MNQLKSTNSNNVKRIILDAALIAIYFGISLTEIPIGSSITITFDSIAVVVGAALFGPIDGVTVGFLGEFLKRLIKYGFHVTTLIWCLGSGMRGLVLGLGMTVMKKHVDIEHIVGTGKHFAYYALIVAASVVTSALNTVAFYVDANVYGYYSDELAGAFFSAFVIRVLTGLVTSVIVGIVVLRILRAIIKSKMIQ
ncbi:MAG: ECF transporter S component [Oscillospiraceae bacterium]|nr:ECF transporter S component [Oscillospiraceae bacterium]